MYYDFTVPVPQTKGKITIKTKGAASYVQFQYGQTYKREKQYVIPQRSIIGKLLLGDGSIQTQREKHAGINEFPGCLTHYSLNILTPDTVLFNVV